MKDQDEKMYAYATWMSKHGGYAKDMTLRDQFAGLAMQSLLTSVEPGNEHQVVLIPKIAYEMADIMLKVREE